MSERIQTMFRAARAQNRAAFIAYLCAGDPDWDTSLAACRAVIEQGTDLLELGVPFSDPLADGLTNQLAAERALRAGMNQERVFDLVRAVREFSEVPIVFYTYYNLVFARGLEAFAKEAVAAGVDGVLVLDLPPEEAAEFGDVCQQHDLQTVYILAPTTPPERIPLISAAATGFLYYVSREGVTGERADMASDLQSRVSEIRKHTQLPLVVGFGISKPEHVADVAAVADGAVVGSALVNCIARNLDDLPTALQQLRATVGSLAAAVHR